MDKLERFGNNLDKLAEATKDIRSFVSSLVDEDSFVETDAFMCGKNFLDGSDALGDGVLTGFATVDGFAVNLFAQNSAVARGGFSAAQAEKICKNIQSSGRCGVPLISVIDSAGAKVGEGISMLEGYAKLLSAVASEHAGLHIAVVKGVCVGLMSAFLSFADVVFVEEKNATVSLGAPMVLAAKAGANASAQSMFGAAKLLKDGAATYSYSDESDLRAKLLELLGYFEDEESSDSPDRISQNLEQYEVRVALKALCDDGKYDELSREYAPELITALARVNGHRVALLACDSAINGGFISRAALKKAARFFDFADKFGFTVVNLVDCNGLEHGLPDGDSDTSLALAELLQSVCYFGGTKISVICGKSVGVGYLAFAAKNLGYDYTAAFATAELSAISPKIAVEVLFAEDIKASANPAEAREKLLVKYTDDQENPFVAAKDGFVDSIIEPSMLRPYVCGVLEMFD